jgi:hypothetical protein
MDTERNAPFQDDLSNSSEELLLRATSAIESGDPLLGVHLYLAAFERATTGDAAPTDAALEGMQRAWNIALEEKQRSLAEYIFERLEPFWTDEEADLHADELQQLAFDKLTDMGYSPEAIEEMTEAMNQGFEQLGASYEGFVSSDSDQFAEALARRAEERGGTVVEPEAPASETPAIPEPEPVVEPASDDASVTLEELIRQAVEGVLPSSDDEDDDEPGAKVKIAQFKIPTKKERANLAPDPNWFDFSALRGFGVPISKMARLGVGHGDDAEFRSFVRMLNQRHGLDAPPSLGTLVFSGPVREDSNCFMVATVGELRVPAVRLRFDTNALGQSVLVVMTSPDFRSRLANLSRNGFEGPAAVIMEDMDLWDVPDLDFQVDEMSMSGFAQMQAVRGARETLNMIQSALDHPEVTVLISAADPERIDPFYLDLIGPYREVEVDLPNDDERRDLWRTAQTEHPSMRGLDLEQMTRLSRNLSRFEIYGIAAESVEEAYRDSLAKHRFCAVHTEDVLARLSNFQPLESEEYQQMEDIVVEALRCSLEGGVDSLIGDLDR